MTPPAGPAGGRGGQDAGGRRLDAALNLLDRQLLDREGRLAGKVDDLELTRRDDGTLAVTAILTGPGALAPRMPGVLGRAMSAVWRGMHPDAGPSPGRIPFDQVTEIGSAVRIAASRTELPTYGLERWVRRNLVEKLPGAGHDPE